MIRIILRQLLQAVILLIIQIFILNNIGLGGYINPYIYVLAILYLPIQTPPWLVQILSFVLGFVFDAIVGTPGMHTSACVFVGFIRPYVLKYISPRDGYDTESKASIKDMGLSWFLRYVVILIVAHHTFLFFVESFNAVNFFRTIGRIILSGIFTITLTILLQYLRFGKISKR
ncbi:MAG: rod shape-determining protein MreD [Bacteroidales bacterium]|jgi:rod shape-determining protein MreD|nr:rod shape-determining protein MreD [Bacteroidales bacterium]